MIVLYSLLFFSNGSGTSYAGGASYTATGAVTLYAQWRASAASTVAVGNYITYNPPAGTQTLSTTLSGMSSAQNYTPSATTRWRVFSISADGVEIIPEGSAASIQLRCINMNHDYYASALTNMSNNFINSTYANSARHLGLPVEEAVETGTWPYTTTTEEMNASDKAIINANPGLNCSTGDVFVGGEKEIWGRVWTTDYVEVMASDGTTSFKSMFSFSDDDTDWNIVTAGIRPVVKLKANVYITGGAGTSASPYTIGI